MPLHPTGRSGWQAMRTGYCTSVTHTLLHLAGACLPSVRWQAGPCYYPDLPGISPKWTPAGVDWTVVFWAHPRVRGRAGRKAAWLEVYLCGHVLSGQNAITTKTLHSTLFCSRFCSGLMRINSAQIKMFRLWKVSLCYNTCHVFLIRLASVEQITDENVSQCCFCWVVNH